MLSLVMMLIHELNNAVDIIKDAAISILNLFPIDLSPLNLHIMIRNSSKIIIRYVGIKRQ